MTKREAELIALVIARAVISKERRNPSDLTFDVIEDYAKPADYNSDKPDQALVDLERKLTKRIAQLERAEMNRIERLMGTNAPNP